jgi:hypothetical protein
VTSLRTSPLAVGNILSDLISIRKDDQNHVPNVSLAHR